MKDHDKPRHPGPWRVMQVDSEFAGLLVAVGFLVMGFVSMPIATWFVIGAVVLGVVVALLLRFGLTKYARVVAGAVIISSVAALLWDLWEERRARRPPGVSLNAVYISSDSARFRLHNRGNWLDCWFDEVDNVDRCELTDENGTRLFEDVYLPCAGKEPIHGFLDNGKPVWGWEIWSRSPDKGIKVPIVYVYSQVLLPQSFYEEAKRDVGCPPR